MKDVAFFVDSKVGYSATEMGIIMEANKRIEAVTCIKFQRINPEAGKKWLLLMKEASATPFYRSYIDSNLKNKVVGNLSVINNV